jgi:hypothetical protein
MVALRAVSLGCFCFAFCLDVLNVLDQLALRKAKKLYIWSALSLLLFTKKNS